MQKQYGSIKRAFLGSGFHEAKKPLFPRSVNFFHLVVTNHVNSVSNLTRTYGQGSFHSVRGEPS